MIFRGLCTDCMHIDVSKIETDEAPTCAAFPGGIPVEISQGGFDHRLEFEGDNGIRFAPDGPMDVARIEAIVENARMAQERFG